LQPQASPAHAGANPHAAAALEIPNRGWPGVGYTSGMGEVTILVGRQGAGKTHYCRTNLPDHVRVCQDEGPARFESLLQHYRTLLERGVERIVIDRTNPRRQGRMQFARLARERGYRVRIVYFDVPREVCERRILQRPNHPTLQASQMHQAINRFESLLEMPTQDECDELVVCRS